MTTLVLLLLGLGTTLITSGIENVSLRQTISDIWNGKVNLAGQNQTTGAPGAPTAITGPNSMHYQSERIVGQTAGTGFVPLGSGSSAGPSPYDAYRAAVVRAYIQSQR